jgi:hypothetical protein
MKLVHRRRGEALLKIRFVSLTLAVAAVCWGVGQAEERVGSIRSKELRAHVEFLSSDEMQGREAGQDGARRAEDYIGAAFARFGLEPLPGRDRFHIDLTLYADDYDRSATALRLGGATDGYTAKAGIDFRPFDFSGEGSVEAEVVFVGYGITAPEHGYDDYAGLDVEGKIVLVLRHEPGEADPASSFDGTSNTIHAEFAVKADRAKEHGARGMLLVTDPLNHPGGDDLRVGGRLRLDPESRSDSDAAEVDKGILAVHVARDTARRMVEPAGLTLEMMQAGIDSGRPPAEFDLGGLQSRLEVTRSIEPVEVAARNVAGFIEGTDPELKDEWIVVGAHHDHVGGYRGEGDTIYNGADDNASGTAGVLALARAFAAGEPRPRRSILFVTFAAEEKGLLGSRALLEQNLIPIDRVGFMLNLDMIGRNPKRPVRVYGDGFVKGLRAIVEAANRRTDVPLTFAGSEYVGNSDHHPFYGRDIPFMFLFTGIHDDYHQVGDHADKLDYKRMERIVRLTCEVLEVLVEVDESPRFIHNIDWLGLQAEVDDSADGRLARVTTVGAHSRARQAGLRPGDVLLAFDGERLASPGTIGERFRAIAPGTAFELTVGRDGEEFDVALERARTGYMGIGPREVGDELRRMYALRPDEGVLVYSVEPGGPSDEAGLRSRDIILQMDGVAVSSATLRGRLAQIGAGESVRLLILRDGKREALSIRMGARP